MERPVDEVMPLTAAAVSETLSPVFVFLAVFLGAILYFRSCPSNVPPGPFIPFRLLFQRQNAHICLTQLSQQYGPIYSFRRSGILTVVINSYGLVKEALVDQADVFSERSVSGAVKLGSGGTKGSILLGNGEEWKELRRFGSHAMRSFGVGKRSLGNKITEECGHLVKQILDFDGKMFDPVHVVSNAVSNIICSISFGDRYEYDDPKFQNLLFILRCLTSEAPAGALPQMFPYIIYLPPYRRNFKRNEFLQNFIADVVEEHRASLDPNDVRDIIDMFLIEVEKEKEGDNGVILDKTRVWRTIFDLFAAGSDTTANSILWTLAIFCHYPDVQDKMFEEITSVIGSEKLPVYEDRLRLPYSEAVLLEIQRFRPVAPVVPHGSKRPTTLGGYHIPEGSRILVNLWASHHDPNEWDEPDEFRPERFLDDQKNVIHPDAHTPFSMGRRICLGESLAKMELFLFLTCLVQRFRFFTPKGVQELPSLDGIHGVTLSPPPYKICAEPRM